MSHQWLVMGLWMDLQSITNLGLAKLELVGLQPTPTLNALSVAFQAACAAIETPGLVPATNEVEVTGSLLGAICSQVKECAKAFPNFESPGCEWVEYQSQKKASWDTESKTGADFGLVLRLGNGLSRIGLFQAKLEPSEDPERLKLHHKSPALSEDGQAEPQFMRLVEYGLKVLRHISGTPETLAELAWLHYVTYGPGKCLSYSLNQMDSVRDEYGRRSPEHMARANSIDLEFLISKPFRELLRMGAEDANVDQEDGWLDTTDEVAEKSILDLAIHIPIFEGIPNSVGNVPKLTSHQTFRQELKRADITTRDFISDAAPADAPGARSPPNTPPGKRNGRYVYRIGRSPVWKED
jgi:hypothetical protein